MTGTDARTDVRALCMRCRPDDRHRCEDGCPNAFRGTTMTSIWVDLLGTEVRYRRNKFTTRTIEAGAGDVLIMIHGVGGHAEAYSRNVKRLGERFHAISIDLQWHGFSGKPPFTTEMVPTYAEQICDLLDSIGVKKASIEG